MPSEQPELVLQVVVSFKSAEELADFLFEFGVESFLGLALCQSRPTQGFVSNNAFWSKMSRKKNVCLCVFCFFFSSQVGIMIPQN